MTPLLLILVPGVFGGVLLALLIARVRIRQQPHPSKPLAAPSPGHINMAHIRIEGVGGLGMVAMAVTVAIGEPHIRMAMAIAVLLGVPFAVALIAWRRRTDAADDGTPGAHSMLPLGTQPAPAAAPPAILDHRPPQQVVIARQGRCPSCA